jgi:hypothetical protein
MAVKYFAIWDKKKKRFATWDDGFMQSIAVTKNRKPQDLDSTTEYRERDSAFDLSVVQVNITKVSKRRSKQ